MSIHEVVLLSAGQERSEGCCILHSTLTLVLGGRRACWITLVRIRIPSLAISLRPLDHDATQAYFTCPAVAAAVGQAGT